MTIQISILEERAPLVSPDVLPWLHPIDPGGEWWEAGRLWWTGILLLALRNASQTLVPSSWN